MKEPSPFTPSEKVFNISLPDTGPNMPKSPTTLHFSEAYDTNDIESSSREAKSIMRNVKKPPAHLLRRSGRNKKPVDRLDPGPGLSQVGNL